MIDRELFKGCVLGATIVWRTTGVKPSSGLIQRMVLSSRKLSEIAEILRLDEFAAEMARIGIPWDILQSLSDRQIICLQLVTDPFARGSVEARLKKAEIGTGEYALWKKNPVFAAHLRAMTQDVLTENEGEINTILVNQALDGKLDHIKYVYELSGKHKEATYVQPQERLDVEKVLMTILEILMRHITDTSLLAVISREIAAAASQNEVIDAPVGPQSGVSLRDAYLQQLMER